MQPGKVGGGRPSFVPDRNVVLYPAEPAGAVDTVGFDFSTFSSGGGGPLARFFFFSLSILTLLCWFLQVLHILQGPHLGHHLITATFSTLPLT